MAPFELHENLRCLVYFGLDLGICMWSSNASFAEIAQDRRALRVIFEPSEYTCSVYLIVLSPSTPDGFPRARIVGFCFFVVCQNRRVSDLEHDIR
jgi:hypothetical protein